MHTYTHARTHAHTYRETQSHSLYTPGAFGWTSWSDWGGCSSSCGPGLQSRTRTCQNPGVSALTNSCPGDSTNYRVCTDSSCKTIFEIICNLPIIDIFHNNDNNSFLIFYFFLLSFKNQTYLILNKKSILILFLIFINLSRLFYILNPSLYTANDLTTIASNDNLRFYIDETDYVCITDSVNRTLVNYLFL